MKIRERLENKTFIGQENNIARISSNINELFLHDGECERILSELINSNHNILLINKITYNKDCIFEYIKQFVSVNNLNYIHNINANFKNNRVNIIKQTSVNDFIKISELAMYGFKSFVFSINLNSFENITEKIKTIIAINFQNMEKENINALIKSLNPVLIDIEQDEHGNMYPAQICTINEDWTLNIIYGKKEELKINEEEDDDEDEENIEIEAVQEEAEVQVAEQKEEVKPTVDEPKTEVQVVEQKEEVKPTVDEPKAEVQVVEQKEEVKPTVDEPKAEVQVVEQEEEVKPTVDEPKTEVQVVEQEEESIEEQAIKEATQQTEEFEKTIQEEKLIEELEPETKNKLKLLKEKIKQKKESEI